MSNVVAIQNEPTTPLDFALAYARLGWKIFPCHYIENSRCTCGKDDCKNPGKHPNGFLVPKGQDEATDDDDIIRKWWSAFPKANIAIRMAASGLVAIDIDPRNGGWDTIDDIEAQNGPLVSDTLQLTGGGGEHRVFSLSASMDAGLPGKLGPGVDVKRNGYIIAEPSNHVSGSSYTWEASSSPLDGIVPSPLPDWLIRGSMHRAGATQSLPAAPIQPLPADLRSDIESALPFIPAVDRDTWLSVGMALHSTGSGTEAFGLWDTWSKTCVEKYDPIDQFRVWRSFRNKGIEGITKATLFQLAKDHGWKSPTSVAPVPAETIRIAKPVEVEAPDSLLNPPGMLGEVASWIDATAIKPQPQFAVQGAIAFMATVLGRRYVTTYKNWPSLYLLNIGKSSSGKEHAKHAIEEALEACELGHLIGPNSYTSDSAIISSLLHQPTHLTVIDEFGKALENASVKGNVRAQSMLRQLMEVWGRCHGTIRPQGYSTFGLNDNDVAKIKERMVRNPALTLIGMATPESFFESIGSAAARDGFLNRFLIVESDIGRQPSRNTIGPEFPESIQQWARRVTSIEGQLISPDTNAGMPANPKVVEIHPNAQAVFDEFEHQCLAKMDEYEGDGLAEMFGRTREIAMRLSLIVAVGCDSMTIHPAHAQWSVDYAMYYAIRTVERLKTSVADSEFEGLKKQVMSLILRSQGRGMTVRELARASTKFNRIDKRAQENVLASLQFLGDIAFVDVPQISGRKRTAWVAIDCVEENTISPPEEA